MFRYSYELWTILNDRRMRILEARLGLSKQECPACTHKVWIWLNLKFYVAEQEAHIKYTLKLDSEPLISPQMIFAIDGNFSLKRYSAAGGRSVGSTSSRYVLPEEVNNYEIDRNFERRIALQVRIIPVCTCLQYVLNILLGPFSQIPNAMIHIEQTMVGQQT